MPERLASALETVSRQESVTLYMTLLAAFQTLLHRYTGEDDIVVGSPVAGRNLVEVEEIVGLFANTIVLRTNLAGDPTFRELLGRVRETALGAQAHDELPFEKLVEALGRQRDVRSNPLFQVMFALHHEHELTMELPELRFSAADTFSGTAKFDLTLSMVRTAGSGLEAALEYRSDMFGPTWIARMAKHLLTLLEGVAADPSTNLSRLSLLTDAERRLLVDDWSGTATAFEGCVHELIERQAARTPAATAATAGGRHLSYAELNRWANRLAWQLQGLRLRPDEPVGICLERGVELAVAVLGILKAGGACLPLDPSYPRERLCFIVNDAVVRLFLTQRRLRSLLPEQDVTVIELDVEPGTVAPEEDRDPGVEVDPDQLAFVFYTSGSTGKPKGVLLHHRAIANYVCWVVECYRAADGQGVPVHSSIGFDTTIVTSLLPPLTTWCAIVAGVCRLDGPAGW